jgi:hypothetical protein
VSSPGAGSFRGRRCLTSNVAVTSIARDSDCHLEKQNPIYPWGLYWGLRFMNGREQALPAFCRCDRRGAPDAREIETFAAPVTAMGISRAWYQRVRSSATLTVVLNGSCEVGLSPGQ